MPLTPEETLPLWTTEDLRKYANHSQPEVRSWAVERLARLYPEAFRAQLPAALRDTSTAVVSSVVGAISGELDEETRPLLQHLQKKKGLPQYVRDEIRDLLAGKAPEEDEQDDDDDDLHDEGEDGERYGSELERALDQTERELKALASDPVGLRAYAEKAFREGDPPHFTLVLEALRSRPERWVGALLLEHWDRLLEHEPDGVWELFAEIGDPRLIEPGVAHHRPGEKFLAATIVKIARIVGREQEIPAQIAQESREEEARSQRLQSNTFDFANAPLRPFSLRCLRCRKVGSYDVKRVFLNSEVMQDPKKEWDGVVFGRIIVCKWCGAQDEYELAGDAHLTLTAFAFQAMMVAKSGLESPVKYQKLVLSDGSVVRRPSQAIAQLKARVERDSDNGEAWRRLANAYEKYDFTEEAVAAWKESLARDEREAEACYSLSVYYEKIDPEASRHYARELVRRQAKQPGEWPLRGGMLVESLRFLVDPARKQKRPLGLRVIPAGAPEQAQTIDLISLRDLSVLEALFEGGKLPELELTEEVQPGALGPLKGHPSLAQLSAGRVVPVRTEAKVGRNDPCPCGSGKKYKKCCGA